ncbi:tetratricopeptide repeat protein [Candidatus Cloacimonadaceae bacterium]
MTERKLLKRLIALPSLILALMLFSCAAPQNGKLGSLPDPSRPNLASIYFYMSASYLHYSGDFASAGQLYQKALEQDPHSPQIAKQILINAAYAFVNGQMGQEEVLAIFAEARQRQSFDADLLNAANTVYSKAKDSEGQLWSINESIARYPSARAYLQKFYFSYSNDGSIDREALNSAQKLASGSHDDLVLTARMTTLADPLESLAILKKALKLDKRSETQRLLAEMSLQFGKPEEVGNLFSTYSYPEDKALILHLLQLANKFDRLPQILALADNLMATEDQALLGELAFAAYMKADRQILNKLWQYLQTHSNPPESDSQIAVFLLADALNENDMKKTKTLAGILYGVQDADDVFLYNALRLGFAARDGSEKGDLNLIPQELNPDLEEALGQPLLQFFRTAAQSLQKDDPRHQSARIALSEFYVLSDKGYESDWSALLSEYHRQNRVDEKLVLLRKAISRFPDNPLFLNDLGYSLLDYPDSLAEAGQLISRAVALEPDNPYYLDSLAWYHYLRQDYASALIHVAIPAQMENPPGEIAYHLALIYKANHDLAKAESFLKKALEDDSSPEYTQKAKAALEQLNSAP